MSIASRILRHETFNIASPLPPEECVRRLKQLVHPVGPMFQRGTIKGSVGRSSFRIAKTFALAVRPPVPTYLYGRMQQVGTKTRISCDIGLPRELVWFGPIYLAWPGLLGASLIVEGVPVPGVVLPLLFAAVPALLLLQSRRPKSERGLLLDLLRETLDAQLIHETGSNAVERL